MRASVGPSIISRLVAAVAVLWLGAGPAWAGAGSGDAASFLATILCPFLSLGQSQPPTALCPSFTPLTQTILEIAALEAAPPEIVRAANAVSPTVAVNAVNPPAGNPFLISNVAPLAFVSSKGMPLAAANPGDASATSFFYAATDGVTSVPGAAGTPPTALHLIFDYPPLTNPTSAIAKGNDLADICLPLTQLSGYVSGYDPSNPPSSIAEKPVPTLLRILNASPSGNAMVVVGSCSLPPTGKSVPAPDWLKVTLAFKPTENSAANHAVIEVQIPLLLTMATDPTYFGLVNGAFVTFPAPFSPFSPFRTPIFVNDECGSTPNCTLLPTGATPLGMSPVAAPIIASIASTKGGGVSVPAVNAFLAISIDGETLVSQLLPPP
jgi:hypothetical protein